MINGLLLKLYVMDVAKYATDELFGKTKEDFQTELDEMSTGDKIELLESYGKVVDEDFSEGGRWTNYRTRVFSFYHESEFVYVSVNEEVPASEMQEDGDFAEPDIEQVYPHKIETTVYKTTKPEAK